jgi:hypothetical protein
MGLILKKWNNVPSASRYFDVEENALGDIRYLDSNKNEWSKWYRKGYGLNENFLRYFQEHKPDELIYDIPDPEQWPGRFAKLQVGDSDD